MCHLLVIHKLYAIVFDLLSNTVFKLTTWKQYIWMFFFSFSFVMSYVFLVRPTFWEHLDRFIKTLLMLFKGFRPGMSNIKHNRSISCFIFSLNHFVNFFYWNALFDWLIDIDKTWGQMWTFYAGLFIQPWRPLLYLLHLSFAANELLSEKKCLFLIMTCFNDITSCLMTSLTAWWHHFRTPAGIVNAIWPTSWNRFDTLD